MEQIVRVYAEALFGVARQEGKLEAIAEQLGEFVDALADSRELSIFLFSPYFSSQEKRQGLERAISGAEPELLNFLGLLAEKHRMAAIFRIRRRFSELVAAERGELDVTVTSAVELDPHVIEEVGTAIERQTGRRVKLASRVDEDVLGGIVLRVGNMVLDASVRSKLEKLRKEVAQPA